MRKWRLGAMALWMTVAGGSCGAWPETDSAMTLEKGWKLASACEVEAGGDQISAREGNLAASNRASNGSNGSHWMDAVVPGTVLGAQVEDGVFRDPFFGMNLRKIPGTDYPIGKIFGYFPMSEGSPYRCGWWYRTEFMGLAGPGQASWLHFDGINYRADIWINGKKVAGSDAIAGAFRAYDLDVTQYVVRGARNVLAVKVFAQTEKELGIDFLDWAPAPADKNMGLWRPVRLETTGPVTVRYPAVSTHFTRDDLGEAELRVVADVANGTDHEVETQVVAEVGAARVAQLVKLAAHETRAVHFDASRFAQLRVEKPQVWWPYQYGEPHLEKLRVAALVGGTESDAKSARFGIREVDGAVNARGHLEFRVNRRRILIRGAGWSPDLFYREPEQRLKQELEYVKEMHLNTIRLEGKLGAEAMFDLADEMGLLVMAGWQCCDAWQKWEEWTAKEREVAMASQWSQVSRLRPHASLLTWMNGSDEVPAAAVEQGFLDVLKEREWPNAVMSTAAERKSAITGPSGVKMSGPYDYVPPEYWTLDKDKVGGAFGFNTETGPGPAVPGVGSIRKTLPKESWWPMDEQWNYHAALGKFAQYNSLNGAMQATYGEAHSLEEYALKAQLMAYDGERAMFEAYGGNKYTATGVIQWMLNNAWPSFVWHLYDYYLVPGGGYFGARKANEPLHIQYRYEDRSVLVVNSTLKEEPGLRAEVKMLNLAGKEVFSSEDRLEVPADGVARVLGIPVQSATVFLKLVLRNAAGTAVSENFYWVPAKLAEMDWAKSTYVNTPALSYADMRDLNGLEKARITAVVSIKGGVRNVMLKNEGSAVAFFVHVRAVKAGTDEEIAPVRWSDNFVSLTRGETKLLQAEGLPAGASRVEFRIDGWNVAEQRVPAGDRKGSCP